MKGSRSPQPASVWRERQAPPRLGNACATQAQVGNVAIGVGPILRTRRKPRAPTGDAPVAVSHGRGAVACWTETGAGRRLSEAAFRGLRRDAAMG